MNRHSGEQRRRCGHLHTNVNIRVQLNIWSRKRFGLSISLNQQCTIIRLKVSFVVRINHFLSSYLMSSLFLKALHQVNEVHKKTYKYQPVTVRGIWH